MTRARSPRFPIEHFHLDITNHCNFRCEFCFHFGDLSAKRGFMDRDLAIRLLDEVADKGISRGVATAVFGEALMHPRFFDIAEHAVARGLTLTLNTKGGALDAETSRRICASGIAKVIVSLNTPDAVTYGINHAPPGLTFEAHVEKIRELVACKLRARSPVQIYVYVMDTHFARPRGLELVGDAEAAGGALGFWRDLLAALAAEHGVAPPPPTRELLRGDPLRRKWPIDRGIPLLPGVELVLKEGHQWGNRMLGPGLEAVPTERGFCPLPWTMLTVNWNGDCSLCCLDYNHDVIVGNAFETSLEAVFMGQRLTGIRSSFTRGEVLEPLCQTCLGGVRETETGEWVRRPRTSAASHVLQGIRKYGVGPSIEHGWQKLRERFLPPA